MTETSTPSTTPAGRIGNRRWLICGLLFFATTINYVDRSVLAALGPVLLDHLHISKPDYAFYVTNGFNVAYAFGLLIAGGLIDRLGTRRGFSLSVIVWSVAGMAAGFATGLWGFAGARFALGLGEAGNFPAAVKTVAEWFPKKERALATGVFNSGTNVGSVIAGWIAAHLGPSIVAALTPFLVAGVASHYIHDAWRWTFWITGALGFIWIVFWLAIYKRPQDDPKLSQTEMDHIMSDPAEPVEKIPWSHVIPHRQAWAFAIGKFLTDPVWWFWLFWLGIFLKDRFNTKLDDLPWPVAVIYTAATIGSIYGGWLSGYLLKRGWSTNAARKASMFLFACLVVPVIGALFTHSMWTAVGLIALAAGAHQAWSCNLFTLVSDMFPRRAVASVVGLGGMMGGLGSVFLNLYGGEWLKTHKDSYLPFFIVAGCGYLIALALIQLLAPRLEPAKID